MSRGVYPSTIFILFLDHCTECCQYSLSDCQDYRDLGHNASGIYHVTPIGTFSGFDVFCDMVKDGGGWLVIMLNSNKNYLKGRDTHDRLSAIFDKGDNFCGGLFAFLCTSPF